MQGCVHDQEMKGLPFSVHSNIGFYCCSCKLPSSSSCLSRVAPHAAAAAAHFNVRSEESTPVHNLSCSC